jgi:hypothetical protein
MRAFLHILAATLPVLLACTLASSAVPTATPTAGAPATQALPVPSETPPPGEPIEAIQIIEPGPGSRLVSPLTVRIQTRLPVFEQTLTLRVLLDDGRDLIPPQAVVASSDEGGRLSFAARLPFTVAEERNAFLQAYATSPRDGGVTHLTSVGMLVMPVGAAQVQPAEGAETERMQILLPAEGAAVRGGVVHVEGFGLATFEQTLLIEVHDANDAVIGLQPVLVQAPDWGLPGPFAADVPYTLNAAGPGRIVVRDISPAHGSDVHRSSVEVDLAP